MKLSHILASAVFAFAALPAQATVTFTGAYSVAGEATDLSGFGNANGSNRLSFGSDLYYDRATDLYYGITDRGPGGGLVDYAPRVNVFRLDTNAATGAVNNFILTNTIVFKDGGNVFSGLNPQILNGNPAILGKSFDPEGFVRLSNGHFLVSDEYGPSIYEFDAQGNKLRAFTQPDNVLPKAGATPNYNDGRGIITTGRQDNRGYEGLTVSPDGTKAYAILQDPLVNEGSNNDGRRSRNLRIVEFDVATGQPGRQFIYQLEDVADINNRIPGTANDFGATDQGRSIGVSSITALADGSFVIIERDNRGTGVTDPNSTSLVGSKRVYRITLDGATDVSGVSLANTNSLGGVVPVNKSLYVDVQAALQQAGLSSVEKLEGLSFGRVLADGSLSMYIVSDNDFSVTQTATFGDQTDVCTSGPNGTTSQSVIGAGCPNGQHLLPSMIYSFRVTGADAAGVLPVPEPGTWAMMITGFGMAGVAMRRRRTFAIA